MIKLNLISEELREKIWSRHFYEKIEYSAWLISSLLVIVSIFLLITRFVALDNSAISSQAEDFYSKLELDQKLKIATAQYSLLQEAESNSLAWSPMLQEIIKAAGDQISLTDIKINTSNSQLVISGIAADRDNLLVFKNYLVKQSVLTNVVLPLNDIINKSQLNFTITANIQLDQLSKQ